VLDLDSSNSLDKEFLLDQVYDETSEELTSLEFPERLPDNHIDYEVIVIRGNQLS
jgi:hypothetical protein